MVIQVVGAVVFLLGLCLLAFKKDVAKYAITAGLVVVAAAFLIDQFVPGGWIGIGVGIVIALVALKVIPPSKARMGGLALGALIVLASAAAMQTATNQPMDRADGGDKCPDIVFVGLRGSGESKQDHGGYGKTVGAVRDRLKKEADAAGLTFEDQPIEYPAVGVGHLAKLLITPSRGSTTWWMSVDDGAERTQNVIRQIAIGECYARSKAVIVGFSQGSWAAHLAMRNTPDFDRKVVGSVDLIADPLRTPEATNPLMTPGTFGSGTALEDAYGGTDPAAWRSWCATSDIVCDSFHSLPPSAAEISSAVTRLKKGADSHGTFYRTAEMSRMIALTIAEDLGITVGASAGGK